MSSSTEATLLLARRLASLSPYLTPSVSINLGLGAWHLLAGLLLGTVKYAQIHASKHATAHPYISTAHRASLMYGFASVQLAVGALLSAWPEHVNVTASIATQTFFVSAVGTYAVHGLLKDTTNQLKAPHKLGEKFVLPPWMVHGFMFGLILAEIGGCSVLCAGMVKTLLDVYKSS
ncbi:hypothetical protein BG004_001831 [Podila humilis]|nr:hypothetical protein BG004_001831 [Podila humilis]